MCIWMKNEWMNEWDGENLVNLFGAEKSGGVGWGGGYVLFDAGWRD